MSKREKWTFGTVGPLPPLQFQQSDTVRLLVSDMRHMSDPVVAHLTKYDMIGLADRILAAHHRELCEHVVAETRRIAELENNWAIVRKVTKEMLATPVYEIDAEHIYGWATRIDELAKEQLQEGGAE